MIKEGLIMAGHHEEYDENEPIFLVGDTVYAKADGVTLCGRPYEKGEEIRVTHVWGIRDHTFGGHISGRVLQKRDFSHFLPIYDVF